MRQPQSHPITMKTHSFKPCISILCSVFFLAMASSAQAANTAPSTPSSMHDKTPHTGTLSGSQAMKMIKTHKKLTIVDVRTPEEFKQAHIPGAISVPIETLSNNMHAIPTGPVLLVCRTGRRAHHAYHLIHDARPAQPLWYLEGRPIYSPNGTYTFQ